MEIKLYMSRLLLMVFLLATTVCVYAVDLQNAKSSGLIGEQLNGYLGVVDASAGSDVRALVKDVNAKRKAKYESIASQNSTSLETVELLAGKKAVEKTQPGNYIQTATGWKKK